MGPSGVHLSLAQAAAKLGPAESAGAGAEGAAESFGTRAGRVGEVIRGEEGARAMRGEESYGGAMRGVVMRPREVARDCAIIRLAKRASKACREAVSFVSSSKPC